MTRLDAKSFLDQAMLLFDQSNMTVAELVRRSQLNRSTIYRLFTGQRDTLDRSTAKKITEGLGAQLEIRGDSVRLYLKNEAEKAETISTAPSSSDQGDVRRERIDTGIMTMLKDVDVEVLEAAEDFVKLIIEMDKEDVINLHQVYKTIRRGSNRQMFKAKLRALAALMMPYETEHEATGVENSC